jgi:hypothetical protein
MERDVYLAGRWIPNRSRRGVWPIHGCRRFCKHPEDKSLTAVEAATFDHWRHDMNAECLEAGKEDWLEKPMSISVEDGARTTKAAR